MSTPIRQFSFSAGELSPALYARTDLDRYANGLRTARNMMVMRQGGITGRPGTEYVSTALNGGNQIRLIPFIFNETGLGQSYLLEFGNQYITFYQNGGNVISSTKSITGITQANPGVITSATHGFSNGDILTLDGILGMTQLDNGYFIVANATANTFTMTDLLGSVINTTSYSAYTSGGTANKIYKIASPYLQADLQNLKFDQCADIVTIVDQNYRPYELARMSPTNWTLTPIVFEPSIGPPVGLSYSGGGAGGYIYGYAVSAIATNGDETDNSVINLVVVPTSGGVAQVSVNNPITIAWDALPGAVSYKVYKQDSTSTGSAIPGLGYIGNTAQTKLADTGILPDYSHQPPQYNDIFDGAGNYPATVGFAQQRRFFGDTENNPVGFWGSRPGSFSNFDVHLTTQDDDPIIGTIGGSEVNSIQDILELKFMLMLTAGAELYLQGDGSGVITPSAINASTQSQYGASPLRPLKVSDVLIFQQALGNSIRDFTFDFAIDGYRGNDITIFSAHLFEGFQIPDWCYQKVPDSIIWAARSDGILLSCTYVREQQILAWTRHDFTNGFVENICSIPENGEYAVYISIRRIINGATVRYIERISSRLWPDTVNTPPVQNDPINASYLDSFLKFDGRNTSGTTMTLTATSVTVVAGVNDSVPVRFIFAPLAPVNYLTLPPGTYTPTTLAAALQTVLMPLSSGFSVNLVGGKISISNVEETDQFELFNQSDIKQNSAGPILGFPGFNYVSILATPTTLTAPNIPCFDNSSLAYQQSLVLTSSAPFFSAAMVGNQIFLEDKEWVYSKGEKGNQVRCTIQSYISSMVVNITPSEAIPSEFQALPTTTWARAIQNISGLGYLEGQIVSIWADRFVVGSPLNSQVDTIYTVSGGSVTLDKQYSVIYIGLPMTQDAEPLDLESYFGETMLGKRKRVSRVAVYVYNTRTFFVGGENPDDNEDNTNDDPLFQLYEEKSGRNQETYDVAPSLMTKQDYVIVPTRWTYSGRVFFRNVDPVPFSLLAIAPNSEDPVQTPYKRGG